MDFGALHYLLVPALWVWWKSKKPESLPKSGHFVSALAAWPVMFPEAIEYLLAEPSVLPAPASKPADGPPAEP